MPRPKTSLPAYCLHKTSGRAVVFIDRKPVYLGKFNSPEARRKYGEIIANLSKGIGPGSGRAKPDPGITVAHLCLKYATEHLPRYSDDEQDCQRGAVRILRELFGETPAADFGPLRLRTVQAAMIERGWSRGYINRQVKRLRFIFKWGVSWELVPKHTPEALRTVPSLGHGDAPESKPRRAIPDEQLQAVRAILDGRNRDLFDLLLLTGARPGELLSLKTGDIDRTGDVWRADLARHKTSHKGKARVLFFNAEAQAILQRYLSADPAKRLFPVRRDSFGGAIKRACEVAFGMPDELRNIRRKPTRKQLADPNYRPPTPAEIVERKKQAREWRRQHVWTPHWLRHTVATRLADELGTEAAQRLLGHADRAMTEHYSRAAERLATNAAKALKIG